MAEGPRLEHTRTLTATLARALTRVLTLTTIRDALTSSQDSCTLRIRFKDRVLQRSRIGCYSVRESGATAFEPRVLQRSWTNQKTCAERVRKVSLVE